MLKIASIVFTVLALGLWAAPSKLASGGKPLVKIAVGAEQNLYDKFAAEDLASYLGRMAGAKFAVVNETELADGEAAIYLGNTAKAMANGLSSDKFDREEWQIKCVDDKSIVVTGGRPIGAFYGVWSLLNHFGCYAITWDQDAIPNKPELAYDGFEERRKPSFMSRMIYDNQVGIIRGNGCDKAVLDKYYRWVLRNGLCGRQDTNPVPYYLGGVYNMAQPLQYHSMEIFVPANKYFKEHPEYYWMREDGVRRPPQRAGYNGGLCVSNPDVRRITTETLLEMIRHDRETIPKDNWPYVYDISKLDAVPYYCVCPECKKMAEEEGSQFGLFLRFLNPIAAVVKEKYPDVIIRTWGEDFDVNNPNRTKPLDNILLWVDDKFTRSDCYRPLTHHINDALRKEFLVKASDGKSFMVWDYWNLGGAYYFNPPRVETMFDAIKPDLKFFNENGAIAMFIEASLDKDSPQNFMQMYYFIASQLMMNMAQDPEKLGRMYLDYYFGPLAESMRTWLDALRDGVAKEGRRHVSSGSSCWDFCDSKFLCDSYMMLKKLMESQPEDSIYRRRVGYELISVVWCIVANRSRNDAYFTAHGVNIDNLVDECRTLVKIFHRRYGGTEELLAKRYATFEERFKAFSLQVPVPEKFKDVPRERLRFLTYANFKDKKIGYGASAVVDPEATLGMAFCGAHVSDDFHGVNKVIAASGKYKFRTTYFEANGAHLTITDMPQDEKYHWYKMDGKAVFKPDSGSFWTQGWAIHANTEHLYVLTDGTEADNTWDEVWFRAKFTGPAYVPASTKKNGIYIDLVVYKRDKAIGE